MIKNPVLLTWYFTYACFCKQNLSLFSTVEILYESLKYHISWYVWLPFFCCFHSAILFRTFSFYFLTATETRTFRIRIGISFEKFMMSFLTCTYYRIVTENKMNRFSNFCSIFIQHIWSVSEHVGSTSGADRAHENNEKGSCYKHVSYLNLFRSRSQVCVTIIYDSVPS